MRRICYVELETLAIIRIIFAAKAGIVSDLQHTESSEKIQYLEGTDKNKVAATSKKAIHW